MCVRGRGQKEAKRGASNGVYRQGERQGAAESGVAREGEVRLTGS